ncbi:MAG TPA: 50S ribosomal protein L22 [Bacteroidia bacterium]|nr:50S ribosomal protein L22 [Bacteroidia bacterium]
MEIKASIKNYRSTPRKARLLADFVRGKDVQKAIAELKFTNKKASEGLIKLLKSAVANAENNYSVTSRLFVKEIRVDEGASLKRFRAGSNGRALPFKRRLSTISVTLAEKVVKAEN